MTFDENVADREPPQLGGFFIGGISPIGPIGPIFSHGFTNLYTASEA